MSSRLTQIALFLGLMWAVFLIDPSGSMRAHGLRPHDRDHFLVGIAMLPMLHGGFGHIMGNTMFLAVLMPVMALLCQDFWLRILLLIIGSGALLWFLGSPGELHIGASGLAFALIGYLAVVAIDRGHIIGAAAIVALGWWQSEFLLSNLVDADPMVSTTGHMSGLIAGLALGTLWKSEPA